MSLCSTRTASIVGLGLKELQDWCASKGLPKYRALLALQYLYRQHGVDWTRCSTFDSQSKRLFSEHWPINLGRLVDEQVSRDGTVKWLWEYDHGARIECTLRHFSTCYSRADSGGVKNNAVHLEPGRVFAVVLVLSHGHAEDAAKPDALRDHLPAACCTRAPPASRCSRQVHQQCRLYGTGRAALQFQVHLLPTINACVGT